MKQLHVAEIPSITELNLMTVEADTESLPYIRSLSTSIKHFVWECFINPLMANDAFKHHKRFHIARNIGHPFSPSVYCFRILT